MNRAEGRRRAIRCDAMLPELFLHGGFTRSNNPRTQMTLNLWIVAGGLMAFAAARTAIRMSRARSKEFTTDQLSGDWLAQARAREEHPW